LTTTSHHQRVTSLMGLLSAISLMLACNLTPSLSYAQSSLALPCDPSNPEPCLPDLSGVSIQKSAGVFYLQARVSPAKLPSGRGQVALQVKISRPTGEVLCSERFSRPVKIREGVLNLEVGRGMDCALPEVLTENRRLMFQLCLGSGSCMRPIELTAVPFALSAHIASEAKQARKSTLSARSQHALRLTADQELLFPTSVGFGYLDTFTHTAQDHGSLYPSPDDLAPYVNGGFLQWTPVRGDQWPSDDFDANQLIFVGETPARELTPLSSLTLAALETRLKGRARLLSGHMVVRSRAEVEGEARVQRRLSTPTLSVTGPLDVTGDSTVTSTMSATGPLTITSEGATLRARVTSPDVVIEETASVTQARATLGAVQVRGPISLSTERLMEVTGDLKVGGTPSLDAEGTPTRRGFDVSDHAHVGQDVKVTGAVTLTRDVDPSAPLESSNQGLFMRSEGAQKRIFSVKESGVIELNKPHREDVAPLSQISIKGHEVIFEDEVVFQDGKLGSECVLALVEGQQKMTLSCGGSIYTFAPDQCGNGRRFRCSCGDGNVDPSEECDDGNDNNLDGCLKSCSLARCGDLLVRADITDPNAEGYEECDDGNGNELDACRSDCLLARCGDGFLRQDLTPSDAGYEECDDGNSDDGDDCTNDCTRAVCGDGRVTRGREECDDGNLNEGDGCDGACRAEVCGNAIVQAGERCDDGNADSGDGCVACQPARCGDGALWRGVERCDDGNQDNSDACVNCQPARCGDGVIRRGVEECDDGNTYPYDNCGSDCQLACANIDKVAHLVDQGGTFTVNTRGRRSSPTSAGGGGPQAAIAITLTRRQNVIFEVTSQDYDSYFHLRRECDDRAHIAYDDDSNGSLRPRLQQTLEAGTYYLIVDGYAARSGTSTVQISMNDCFDVPVVHTINPIYSFFGWLVGGYASGVVHLNTSDGSRPSQGPYQCGGRGPQEAIAFTLLFPSRVHFRTEGSYDTVLHLRRGLSCSDMTDITCDDDAGSGLNSDLSAHLSPGTYYLIVDGYRGQSGDVSVYFDLN